MREGSEGSTREKELYGEFGGAKNAPAESKPIMRMRTGVLCEKSLLMPFPIVKWKTLGQIELK